MKTSDLRNVVSKYEKKDLLSYICAEIEINEE